MKSLPFVKSFYLNSDGTGGGAYHKLQTLEVGSENNKITYKDPDGVNDNTNPIILNARGDFDLYYAGNLKLRYLDPDDAVIWTIENIESTLGGGGTLSIVSTMQDLKDLDPGEFDQVVLAGYYVSGDKDARLYTWSGASTATDNDGSVVTPTGLVGPGRWLMEHLGEVTTLDFGMKGDSVSDDLTALTAALNFVQDKFLTLVAPPSPAGLAYLIDSNSALLENGGEWKLKILPGASFLFVEPQEIGGIVDAAAHQWIIEASAQVLFNDTSRLTQGAYPEWWGGLADDTFDNVDAFATMFASDPRTIVFSKGTYATSGGIGGIPNNTSIELRGLIEDMAESQLLPIGYQIVGGGTLIKANDLEAVENVRAGVYAGSGGNVDAGTTGAGLLRQRMGTGTQAENPAVASVFTLSDAAATFITSGVGNTELMTKFIPAGSLVDVGDAIRITAGGICFGTDADALTWRVVSDTTTLLEFVLDPEGGNPGKQWHLSALLMKSAAGIIASGLLSTNLHADISGGGLTSFGSVGAYKSTAWDINNLDIEINGQAAGGSITQNLMLIEYIKAKP
jgi:hypothetical protein